MMLYTLYLPAPGLFCSWALFVMELWFHFHVFNGRLINVAMLSPSKMESQDDEAFLSQSRKTSVSECIESPQYLVN